MQVLFIREDWEEIKHADPPVRGHGVPPASDCQPDRKVRKRKSEESTWARAYQKC